METTVIERPPVAGEREKQNTSNSGIIVAVIAVAVLVAVGLWIAYISGALPLKNNAAVQERQLIEQTKAEALPANPITQPSTAPDQSQAPAAQPDQNSDQSTMRPQDSNDQSQTPPQSTAPDQSSQPNSQEQSPGTQPGQGNQ